MPLFFFAGLALIGVSIFFGIRQYRKNQTQFEEARYQQTTAIGDVIDIMQEMLPVDPGYRHYCEIKGILQNDIPMLAPYSDRPAVYYENQCLAVTQQLQQIRDKRGNRRTIATKQETEVSREQSSSDFYILDTKTGKRVYVDFLSLGKNMELLPGCDRFEQNGSPYMQSHPSWFPFFSPYGGGQQLGYRLKESYLPLGQPVYALGEVYPRGDRFYLGEAMREKKPSLLTYRTEDEIVGNAKKKKSTSLLLFIGGVLLGVIVCVVSLLPFFFTDSSSYSNRYTTPTDYVYDWLKDYNTDV